MIAPSLFPYTHLSRPTHFIVINEEVNVDEVKKFMQKCIINTFCVCVWVYVFCLERMRRRARIQRNGREKKVDDNLKAEAT
jgi:hypothetical protein